MRRLIGRALLAFATLVGAGGPVMAAAVAVDKLGQARAVIADLDHFIGKFAAFAPGTSDPLFYGRSLPVPPESCSAEGEPRRFGLLIGPEAPGPERLAVPAVLNDVKLLTSVLTSVGAAQDDIHVLTGDRATRQGVIQETWNVLSQLGCGDKVFVYFGGYALKRADILQYAVKPDEPGPSGRALTAAREAGRELLQGFSRADLPADLDLELRRRMEMLDWIDAAGMYLLLNGDGVLGTDPLTLGGFEAMAPADLSELVTLLRNHRADVTVVVDTNHASSAALVEQQQAAAAGYWSADVARIEIPARDARLGPTRLIPAPGELAVFYSSVDDGLSMSTQFDVGGQSIDYGLFTFRVAEAMVNGRNATVQGVRDALDRIVRADTERREQTHRVESTRADMPVFGRIEGGRQRTDTIRILEPSGMRGASVLETPQVDLVGVVDWRAPTKAVLVEGQPASLTRDGRFSASVKLNAGLNTISVTALTSDDEIHVMPPLEIMFDGDLKKLQGEGRRFALIIANQNYLPETKFSTLKTPIADAEALRAVLTERYGFSTQLPVGSGDPMPLFLVDASKNQIEETLYTLSQVAGEQDQVLIYYAGHGVYDERTTNAYWVPVDAAKPFNYLSGVTLTEHIQRILARSVILISDSCYAGALRSGGDAEAPAPGATDEDRQRALLRMAELRSRILITSGGTEPVMDTGGGGHSIFARALLTGLSQMQGDAFAAEDLFRDYIRPMVTGRVEQMPQFRPIERTGHEPSADVVFVRTDG